MTENFQAPPNRQSAALLATCLVFLLGAIGLAVLVSSNGDDPGTALILFSIVLALMFCFGVLFRRLPASSASSAFAWIRHRDARPADIYMPKRRSRSREYGTNQPLSLNEARELKDSINTWVPTALPRRRKT